MGTETCSHAMIRKGAPLKTSIFENSPIILVINSFRHNYPTDLATNALLHLAVTAQYI